MDGSGAEWAGYGSLGDRLGERYRLVSWLGAGGMAVVWLAHDEVLNRQVAVKVLSSELAASGDAEPRSAIRAEARAVARLSHPNITNVFDYGEIDGLPYVVMELLEGQTLSERYVDGALTWRDAALLGAEVAAALATAHAQGIVHRDIKPANIMLTSSGAKVLDFGIAGLIGATEEVDPQAPVLGTPGYFAPERLSGEPLTAATDVYALGMLLYRSLAGRLPWPAETVTQLIEAQVLVEPAPLPDIAGMPAAMEHLIARCLARVPSERPESVEVARLLSDLAGINVVLPKAGPDSTVRPGALKPEPVVPEPPRRSPSPVAYVSIPVGAAPTGRRRLVQAGAAVAVAAAVVGGLAAYNRHGGKAAEPASAAPADGPAGAGDKREGCWVDAVTRVDTAGTFTTRLTLVNTGTDPFRGWTLGFRLVAGERLASVDGAQMRQNGATVQLTGAVELPAGKAITVGVSGTGARAGAGGPSAIMVNTMLCVAQVRQLPRPDQPLPPVTGVTDPPVTAPVAGGQPAPADSPTTATTGPVATPDPVTSEADPEPTASTPPQSPTARPGGGPPAGLPTPSKKPKKSKSPD